jgi:hypothetical protein
LALPKEGIMIVLFKVGEEMISVPIKGSIRIIYYCFKIPDPISPSIGGVGEVGYITSSIFFIIYSV